MATSSPTRPYAGFKTISSQFRFRCSDGHDDFGSSFRQVVRSTFNSSHTSGKRFDCNTMAFPGLLRGVELSPNHGCHPFSPHITGNHSAGESRITADGSPFINEEANLA